jgi:hypothetical protein
MDSATSREAARQAKARAGEVASGFGKVVGVGVTKAAGGYAVKVSFEEPPSGTPPAAVDGVPVVYVAAGKVSAAKREPPGAERITVEEAHRRMKAQGVSAREHVALKCPMCGTVQSMATLLKAGANADNVESFIGYSCEGRFSDAGPWPSPADKSQRAARRRRVRGCDWTLGGLFHLHKLEVETPNGVRFSFEIATPEEARDLERQVGRAAA